MGEQFRGTLGRLYNNSKDLKSILRGGMACHMQEK